MPYPHVIRLRGPWQYTPLARFGEDPLPPPGRVDLPTDWGATLGDDFRGRVRYERNFNPPTNLDPHERIWLAIDGADARADVSLNGRLLGTVDGYALPAEWDITEIIGSRNLLSLDLELPDTDRHERCASTNSAFHIPHSALQQPGHRQGSAPATGNILLRPGREILPGGPIGEVRLEIRSTAFTDDFALWIAVEPNGPALHCSGTVRGDAEAGPLCLVIGALEREILYEDVNLGQPFQYTAAAGEVPIWLAGRPSRLAAVEVKLISGGEAVWQRQLETAAIDVEAACAEPSAIAAKFVSGGLELQIEQLLNQIARVEPAVIMPQILPEPLYERFDRAGVAVWQTMPLAWADRICPRLAHHPSICAWVLPKEESPRHTAPLPSVCGRPWILCKD